MQKISQRFSSVGQCVLLFTAFVTASCAPMGKESYLKKFDSFIASIADKHKSWDEGDWTKQSERFDKFSDEWYDKFSPELTWQEKLKVTGLQAKFHYYRTLDQSSSFLKDINGLLESLNVNEIKNQVRYYIDHDMTGDLDVLYDEALKVGGKAMETVTKIFDELGVDADELQQ